MRFANVLIDPGRIYILRNPLHQDALVKIGRTRDIAEKRAIQLSSPSGVPYKFEVLYEEEVADCSLAEKLIHRELEQYRVQRRREFFQLPLKLAVRTVFQICLKVNQSLIKERSRLAIWLNDADMEYAHKLKNFLLPIRGGHSAVYVILKNEKAECHLQLGENYLIHCTPDVLTKLRQEPWIQEVFLHVPLE